MTLRFLRSWLQRGVITRRNFSLVSGVEFTERNVSEDSKAREELLAMGYRAAPVIKVDNQTMLGFDAEKLRHFLGLKG